MENTSTTATTTARRLSSAAGAAAAGGPSTPRTGVAEGSERGTGKRSRSEKPADVEDSPQGRRRRRSLHRTSRPPLAVPLLILLRRPPVHPVLASALSLSVGPLLPAVVAAVSSELCDFPETLALYHAFFLITWTLPIAPVPGELLNLGH
ncbi:hypothetical protein B296_00015475 [Ensete ventricosum]|uniref:Uncharacterized protein n=1 Tax=Ensete ventricosum TaxID=4639 RepID=A0A426ZPS8_ENSVE|nr:hypothetical protein B296_00015475 [Ensete ventricosum]